MRRILAVLLLTAVITGLAGCALPEVPVQTVPKTQVLPTDALPTEAPTEEPTQIPTDAPTEAPTEPPAEPPTEPPTEPIALPEPADGDLVRIIDYIPSIRQSLAYATRDNFTGKRIYDFTDAYLRYGTVKKLAKACEELAQQGLGILIWDGFRPVYAQAMLWEAWPDPAYVSHPVTGTRAHCRGNAVDLTLVNLETGELLEMPTGFDDFSALADRNYSDCTEEAAANARILEEVMSKHGFKPYSAEWWHFTDAVSYPVDEYFDPAVPNLWYADCEDRIHMRIKPAPNQGLIASLLKGKTAQLRGWDGRYAKIFARGVTGYVLAAEIQPVQKNWLSERLDRVKPTAAYTYEQMLADLDHFRRIYPESVTVETIGKSELGRDIPVLRIGNEDAEFHVLLQGAIHGREHMSAWLLMAMADYWLDRHPESYGDVCYHIIPMSNPDGVMLSQTGKLTEDQEQIFRKDTELGHTELSGQEYAALWKANGLGVDVNRNFPAGWQELNDRTEPSSELYQGTEAFSSAEARVLRDYTLCYDFDATISYHASGSVIFYGYGDKEPINGKTLSLAEAVGNTTGYTLVNSEGMSGGGYKDWAIDALGIPSLTLEIGSGDAPLSQQEIADVFIRNFRVLPAVARWLQE